MKSVLRCLLLCGLAVAAAGEPVPGRRSLLGDDAISTWILHFDPRLGEAAAPAYRDLLAQIAPDARVLVAVRGAREAAELRTLLGADERLSLLHTGRALSAWARDRYVCFRRGDRPCVLLPDPALVQEGKEGDLSVGRSLRAWTEAVDVMESGLSLEGGNVLVTADHVFVGANAVEENADWCGGHRDVFSRRLASVFGRPVVVVGDGEPPPHDHLDMYVSAVGRGRVLVGDARLDESLMLHPDVERERQERSIPVYDRLAEQLESHGFQVFRLPIVHLPGGDLITWNNAVTERVGGRDVVYLPSYGWRHLDRSARTCWRRLGFEVRPIDVSGMVEHGGAVRCLTNALRAAPTRANRD